MAVKRWHGFEPEFVRNKGLQFFKTISSFKCFSSDAFVRQLFLKNVLICLIALSVNF